MWDPELRWFYVQVWDVAHLMSLSSSMEQATHNYCPAIYQALMSHWWVTYTVSCVHGAYSFMGTWIRSQRKLTMWVEHSTNHTCTTIWCFVCPESLEPSLLHQNPVDYQPPSLRTAWDAVRDAAFPVSCLMTESTQPTSHHDDNWQRVVTYGEDSGLCWKVFPATCPSGSDLPYQRLRSLLVHSSPH